MKISLYTINDRPDARVICKKCLAEFPAWTICWYSKRERNIACPIKYCAGKYHDLVWKDDLPDDHTPRPLLETFPLPPDKACK